MSTAVSTPVTLEFRIGELYADPNELAEQAQAAAKFVELAQAAGFEVGEEGESHDRWFWITAADKPLDDFLNVLAAANITVSASSDDLNEDDASAVALAAHPAVAETQFAPGAAEQARRTAMQAAAAQIHPSERDPWKWAVSHKSEVRVALRERGKLSDKQGWAQIDARHPDGYTSVRISLDDGNVVWGASVGWDYVRPLAFRPLSGVDATEHKVSFDYTVTVVATLRGDQISESDLREHYRRTLATELAQSVRHHITDARLGVDGKALPRESDLPWGADAKPGAFDRPLKA